MKEIKLNLGCGQKYLSGYINCDYVNTIKTDKKVNLEEFPYPFKDNYADEILMDNVLEHLDDIVKVMEELHRILKKDGKLKIYVPYAKSDGAIQDPTHKHFFTEKTMQYFDDNFDYSYYSKAKFRIIKSQLYSNTDNLKSKIRNLLPFRNILKNFIFNMYDGIYFELRAVK